MSREFSTPQGFQNEATASEFALGDAFLNATQSSVVTGTLACTAPSATCSFSGDHGVTGTMPATTPSAVCSFTGLATVSGVLAATTPSASASFTGTVGEDSALAPIAPSAVCSFTGMHGVTGTLGCVAPSAVCSFTGTHGVTGTLGCVAPSAVCSFTGTGGAVDGALVAIAPRAACSFTMDVDVQAPTTPLEPGFSGMPAEPRRRRRGVGVPRIAPEQLELPPAPPLAVVGTLSAITPAASCSFEGVAAVAARMAASPFLKTGVLANFRGVAMADAEFMAVAPSVTGGMAGSFELVSDEELMISIARIHQALRARERLRASDNAADRSKNRRPLPRRKRAPELV